MKKYNIFCYGAYCKASKLYDIILSLLLVNSTLVSTQKSENKPL